MVNGRAKGANGEREAAKWLQLNFGLANCPQRNLEQVRSGGHDLVGFEPFAFEVKRCEAVSLRKWWLQCVTSASKLHMVPVVMFRQNNKPWRFLISAKHIGLQNGFIQLEEREFILWAKLIIKRECDAGN